MPVETIIVLAVVVGAFIFFAIILARPLGVTDFTVGVWPIVALLPLLALPIAFILIIVLLAMSIVRRSRANKSS